MPSSEQLNSGLQPLVALKHHNIALLFANYLLSIGITANVQVDNTQPDSEQFVVHCQANKLAQAQQLFEQFIENPHDEKYQQAAWNNGDITKITSSSPSLLTTFKKEFLAHAGVVTLTIFAICWLVFLASRLGWSNLLFQQLHFFEQLSREQLFEEPWRILGPALFHFSWLHIVFNTMWWWQLGGSIERIMGKGALIQLFLVSAILSNLGQFMVSGPNFGGLSGVVYGVVGYVWWAGWLAPEKGLHLSQSIIGFLLFWLLLGYVDVLPVSMANTAHLLGLLSGCLLAWLTFQSKKSGKSNSPSN